MIGSSPFEYFYQQNYQMIFEKKKKNWFRNKEEPLDNDAVSPTYLQDLVIRKSFHFNIFLFASLHIYFDFARSIPKSRHEQTVTCNRLFSNWTVSMFCLSARIVFLLEYFHWRIFSSFDFVVWHSFASFSTKSFKIVQNKFISRLFHSFPSFVCSENS